MNYLRQAESNLEERVDHLLLVARNKKFTLRKVAGYCAGIFLAGAIFGSVLQTVAC